MQLTMLKESFFFLPSYKYGHLKRTFFSGANVEEDVEDVAFPVFGFAKTTAVVVWHILFWSYNSRKLFQASAPLKQKYALDANEYPSPPPDKSKCKAEKKKISFTELTGRFIARKTIFVCCSQKVVLRGRSVSVDKFLSALRQVGRTWRGQLIAGIWRIFWLS